MKTYEFYDSSNTYVIIKCKCRSTYIYAKITLFDLYELWNKKFFYKIYILCCNKNKGIYSEITEINLNNNTIFEKEYNKQFCKVRLNISRMQNCYEIDSPFRWFLCECLRDKDLDKKYFIKIKRKEYVGCTPKKFISLLEKYKRPKYEFLDKYKIYNIKEIISNYMFSDEFPLDKAVAEKQISSDLFLTNLFQSKDNIFKLFNEDFSNIPEKLRWYFYLYYKLPNKQKYKFNINNSTIKINITTKEDFNPIIINNNIPYTRKTNE